MKVQTKLAAALLLATAGTAAQAEVSANATVANNYLWRGLTQTVDEAMVSGGIDYSNESGFYAGTWAANVSYGANDPFSYEHDIYFGFAGEAGDISYDVGYLYYNYNDAAGFDFAEVYGSLGYGGLSATLSLLAHTEADEGEGRDYGFGKASYFSVDYGMPVFNGAELGLHVGYHQGDFAEDFNGVPDGYADWGISLSKDGFSFAVTGTDLDDTGADAYDNDSVKFAVSYSIDFEL